MASLLFTNSLFESFVMRLGAEFPDLGVHFDFDGYRFGQKSPQLELDSIGP